MAGERKDVFLKKKKEAGEAYLSRKRVIFLRKGNVKKGASAEGGGGEESDLFVLEKGPLG